MKYLTTLTFVLLFAVSGMAQEFIKEWQGYANVEFSRGIAGYARKSGYLSAGVAASYGMLINDHYYIGLGIKPNYIFSDGDFDGFFLPTYAEFKYKSSVNEKLFGYYGIARLGYSVVDQRGVYAHIGGGLNYKRWEFGIGISYQYTKFKEKLFDEPWYLNYNMVFGTISVGYRF
ncbi:MAG: hypothetical protein IJ724_02995 [Muribaculaceae bacterium]|nr:hypothetical protein [Muribaculaceae bacterium]